MSPYLVALAVGDWECVGGSADGIPIRVCGTPNRKDRAWLRARGDGVRAAVLQSLLRHQVSIREARHRRGAGLLGRRDGKHRRDCLSRAVSRRREERRHDRTPQADRAVHRPRNRAPVVRRSRHHGVVGRHLAERGLRDLDGVPPDGRNGSPSGTPRSTRCATRRRAMDLDALRATRPVRTKVETPERDQPGVRRDCVPEDGRRHQDGRRLRGRCELSGGHQRVSEEVRLRATPPARVSGRPWQRSRTSRSTVCCQSYITQEQHAARERRNALRRRQYRSSRFRSGRSRLRRRHRRSGTFRCATSASAAGKSSRPRASLLSATTQTMKLDGCSSWVFANVDSRGYYRTSYEAEDLRALGEAVTNNELNAARADVARSKTSGRSSDSSERSIAEYLSLSSQLMKSRLSPAISTALSRINYISESARGRVACARRSELGAADCSGRLWSGWDGRQRPSESDDDPEPAIRRAVHAGHTPARSPMCCAKRDASPTCTSAGPRALHPSILDTALQLARHRGRRCAVRAVSGTNAQQPEPWRAGAVPGGPVLLRRIRRCGSARSPMRRRTDIRSQDAPTLISPCSCGGLRRVPPHGPT